MLLNRGATERLEGLRTGFFLFCAGVLMLTGLVFGLLHRSIGSRPDTGQFAILAVLVGVLLLLEYLKFVVVYPYPWHFLRLVAISTITALVGIMLPVFVSTHLQFGRRLLMAGALLVTFVGIGLALPDPDDHSLNMLRVAVGVASALAIAGTIRRRTGATWILGAVTANLIPIFFTGFRYADHWFFVGFLAMVAVLLSQMARTVRRQARERNEALVNAERLKYELLRKTIQPHFLMNSLAVAIAHVEEEPARGTEMLRDLAAELQTFFTIGERARIPLDQELDLCRKHVRTMGHVLDRRLEFTVSGAGVGLEIPPGVLLTLVENAITHGRLAEEPRISVGVRQDRDRIRIDIENPASATDGATVEGAGLRFVRAQLAGETSGKWSITYGYHDGCWRTRIERRVDATE